MPENGALPRDKPHAYPGMQAQIPDIRKVIHKKKEGLEVIDSRSSLAMFIVDKTFFIFSIFHKSDVSYDWSGSEV